jgi:hypothetical protein
VVDRFLQANLNDDFLPVADAAVDRFCDREGADNSAAALAALCELTLLTWADASGRSPQELLDRVRRRIDGDGPPPAMVRA